jgi:hypothetical protein
MGACNLNQMEVSAVWLVFHSGFIIPTPKLHACSIDNLRDYQ